MLHLLTGPRPDAEVIVVGAAPPGAATAARLAAAGVPALGVSFPA